MAYYEKRANGSWRAQIRRKGFPELNATFDSKQDAEIWASQQEAAMRTGRFVDLREATKVTLGEGLKKYKEERTPTKKGAKQESDRIEVWLKHPLAAKALSEVTSKDLSEYRDQRLKEGKSASTIRSELSVISMLYKTYDTDWGMPGLPNPMASVRLPKVKNARDRRLDEDEMESLLKAAAEKSPEMPLIILLAIETVMRRTELLTLTRDQVKGCVASLDDSKNGSARKVPLSKRALELLSQIPERDDGRCFSLKPNTVTNYMAIVRKAAGVNDIRFHDMRHEGTSRVFEKGFGIMEASAVTGHKSLSQLKRYTHPRPEDLAKKLDG